jgi:hypothetical protein
MWQPAKSRSGNVEFVTMLARMPATNSVRPSMAWMRKAGSIEDYDFSDANKSSGIPWIEAAFNE